MKIWGNFNHEKIEKVLEMKYKHLSYDVFKYLCMNENVRCSKKYSILFSELLAYFSKDTSEEKAVQRAIREHCLDSEAAIRQIEQSLERYFLEYPTKKHLLK